MARFQLRIMVVVGAFVVLALAWMAYDPRGLRLWWRLGHDVAQLDHENAVLTAQVDVLRKRASALRDDPRALERSARESGYVRSNEILIELK